MWEGGPHKDNSSVQYKINETFLFVLKKSLWEIDGDGLEDK